MAGISDFTSQLQGGGARPNQFRVELTFPGFVSGGTLAGQQSQFLCKATSLPESRIDPIKIFYRGRPVNLAGERTFSPWSITVYNDTTFSIRNALEKWQSGIASYNTTNGKTRPTDYQADLQVHQLDRNGGIIKSYKFYDSFPISVGSIELDFNSSNEIEMFQVEFEYNYFEPK